MRASLVLLPLLFLQSADAFTLSPNAASLNTRGKMLSTAKCVNRPSAMETTMGLRDKVKSKVVPLVIAGCLALGAPFDAEAARKSGGRAGGSNFKKAPTQQSQSFQANQNSPDGRVSGFATAGNKPATTSTAATAAPAQSTTVVHHHHHGGGGGWGMGGFGLGLGTMAMFGGMSMLSPMGMMMSPFGYRPMLFGFGGPSLGTILIAGGLGFLIYKLFFSNRRNDYY